MSTSEPTSDTQARPPRWSWPRTLGAVAGSFVFRYGCFAFMVWLALHAERRPAPHLPDAIIDRTPYLPWVQAHNYTLWVACYLPVALIFMVKDARRFVRYMLLSGLLAVTRGLCILATGLGPVTGADNNVVRLQDPETFQRAFLGIVDVTRALVSDAPHIYLTKDLFFSGHTATTFLLLLYVWRYPWLRWPMLVGHILVVLSLFFGHIHYTIDVIGAYAITLSFFALAEGNMKAALHES
ncbi:MAG: phosphatase PAP2-related protein [Planctomycetota bacterium]|jgi:hypothetical protein